MTDECKNFLLWKGRIYMKFNTDLVKTNAVFKVYITPDDVNDYMHDSAEFGKSISHKVKEVNKELNANVVESIAVVNICFNPDIPHSIGSKQLYEIIFDNDEFDWDDDDFDEFDYIINQELKDVQAKFGIKRPIFFTDEKEERKDVIRSLERIRESMDKGDMV